VTHIPRETLDRKLEGIWKSTKKFLGVDPREEPMKVFPRRCITPWRHLGE